MFKKVTEYLGDVLARTVQNAVTDRVVTHAVVGMVEQARKEERAILKAYKVERDKDFIVLQDRVSGMARRLLAFSIRVDDSEEERRAAIAVLRRLQGAAHPDGFPMTTVMDWLDAESVDRMQKAVVKRRIVKGLRQKEAVVRGVIGADESVSELEAFVLEISEPRAIVRS